MLMSASAMSIAGTNTMPKMNSTSTPAINSNKGVCAGEALDKRESSIITALDINNQAVKSALTIRKDGLKKLYLEGKTEGKKDERKAVWSAFSVSIKSANTDLRNSRRGAWDQFNKDMKSCGVKVTDEKLEVVNTPTAY